MPGVDGIVSGLDTTAMINAIVGVAAVPMKVMESHLNELEGKKEKIAGLSNRFTTLSDTIENLDSKEKFEATKLTQLDDTQFTANVGENAVPGIYDVQVLAMATNEVEVSQAFADKATTGVIEEGTYEITYGSTTTNVTIDSSNSSLEKLAEEINNIEGVTSYVMDTGATTDPYRLVIQGQDTGASNTLGITISSGSGTGTTPTFTEQIAAADASVLINGISVNNDTNNIKESIPGVTLDLWETGSAAVRVTVAKDEETMTSLFEGFINSFNDILTYHDINSVYNQDENLKGPLVGESGASRAISGIGIAVSNNYSMTGELVALSQIGVKTEKDGKLSLDKGDFQDALRDHYDDVVELVTSSNGPLGTMKTQIDDLYVESESGILSSRSDSLQSSIETIEEDIIEFDDYLQNYEERLRSQFTSMEIQLGKLQSVQGSLTAMMASLYTSSG